MSLPDYWSYTQAIERIRRMWPTQSRRMHCLAARWVIGAETPETMRRLAEDQIVDDETILRPVITIEERDSILELV